MARNYTKKLMRRFMIACSQFGHFPIDLFRQISMTDRLFSLQEDVESPLKILVIVHAYWPRQFSVIVKYLNGIKMPLTIVVTIPEGNQVVEIEQLLQTISRNHRLIPIHVKNAGRDVGPFVQAINAFGSEKWDLVIKVHTKASQNIWFESLLRSLLKNDRRIVRHVKLLKAYPKSGIVHPLFRYPGHKQTLNEPAMRKLRELMESRNVSIGKKWFFPAGSMFTTTIEVLLDFVFHSENLGLNVFEDESLYSQSSTAHLLERFLGLNLSEKDSNFICTSILDYLDLKALFVKIS